MCETLFFPFRLSIERKPGGFPKTGSGQTTKVEVKFGIVLSDPSIQVLQISNQDQVQVRVEIHPDQVKNEKKENRHSVHFCSESARTEALDLPRQAPDSNRSRSITARSILDRLSTTCACSKRSAAVKSCSTTASHVTGHRTTTCGPQVCENGLLFFRLSDKTSMISQDSLGTKTRRTENGAVSCSVALR